ncbi:hypothetical protein BH11BAC1_BH11BAC1_14560 [soil metagenome]
MVIAQDINLITLYIDVACASFRIRSYTKIAPMAALK